MSPPKVTIVDGDDWMGIYINGRLARQNHDLTLRDVLNLLGIKHKYIYADSKWLQSVKDFPPYEEDVVGEIA